MVLVSVDFDLIWGVYLDLQLQDEKVWKRLETRMSREHQCLI